MAEPSTEQGPSEVPPPNGPLIISDDADLIERLLRLCAAAGADPCLARTAPPDRSQWEGAPLILVGDDLAEQCTELPRRGGVLLIGRDLDDSAVWMRAVRVGADHVLFLPDADPWLLDRIADAVEGVGAHATTVAVLGGRGGAGASTLACALAVTAARQGHRTMLIDGDPLGGGLDVLLGAEQAAGLRWPDLAGSRGRVNGAELERALPGLHHLAALSWDRSDTLTIPPEAMRTVLAAARRRGGLVVLDLPRHLDPAAAEALEQTDTALLVVPSELRAVAAAGRVAATVRMRLTDLRTVLRTPGGAGLDGQEVARGLGTVLAGELPDEPGLTADVERGRPPGLREHGPLARFCSAFLLRAVPPPTAGRSAVV
ncbi:septum site-determining protein Ssd [Streptacidiphilus griseoplanus]|uniref:septum site-determining protein Ssd n=1 Tax=Peterkaempfera griseoplana TaxID=66896 RepID=UPI0006E29AE2|nr:septum site-determining protein Ssd [Peterkaempfera griseoplana]